MNEGEQGDAQRPARYNSFPLGHVTPRWDAGIRYWPGAALLGCVVVLFIGLIIAFGSSTGPLAAGAVVAAYPILLVALPTRRRLVPREIGTAASSAPMRLWTIGWSMIAVGVAAYPLGVDIDFGRYGLLGFGAYAALEVILIGGVLMLQRAPAWEKWRQRPPRKGRRTPHKGTGAATVGNDWQ